MGVQYPGVDHAHHMIHQITVIIREFRSAENTIDAGLLFAPSGVTLEHGVGRKLCVRPEPAGRHGQSSVEQSGKTSP
jgi:hypothetical protein